MAGKNYTDLIAWQRAMDLVVHIYDITANFPREEMFTLTSQLRRAAISIPSNIAEGQGRATLRDFNHFLSIAYGSLREVETQILIAYRLSYVNQDTLDSILSSASEIGRLLNGLMLSIARRLSP